MKTSTLVLLGLVAATLIVDPISALRCRVYENLNGIVKRKQGETECNPEELCSTTFMYAEQNYFSINECSLRRECPQALNKMTRVGGFLKEINYCCDTDLCNPIMPGRLAAERIARMYAM
ncbi:hypothetical protein QR680_011058 [Steinernema hermaphroditum]|uniref:UPAR/Ly6 domain-containing protein n=1 Tax=Steinernema hermaphroditum TaxID=289476 RepID=A0AA39IQY9_9BILA|nr:hypothetical protein QR680_011058 [Steinernema hermaphroditum]